MKITNGTIWTDTDGNVLHAHGGWILQYKGIYYWYGENRQEDNYVDCYSSADLVNWKFENHVLTKHSAAEAFRVRSDLRLQREDGGKVNIERPKVVYNEKTKQFVMWMHYENGTDYLCAAAAVATCDTPTGDFVYHGSFRPFGEMSRDCTLFQDGEKMYFLSASRDNADMHMYLLQEDYLNAEKFSGSFWPGEYREAPALLKQQDTYYCFSSFCTGWAPNQGKYARTQKLEDGFGMLTKIGDETTYHSQPAFILTISGSETTSYVYVGDRWDGNDYPNSRYVWYPLEFDADGSVKLIPCEELDVDVKTGKVTVLK